MARPTRHVFVCMQSRPPGHPRGSCGQKDCSAVYQSFAKDFETRQLYGQYALTNTGCLGACQAGTAVLVYPDGVLYTDVKPDDATAIVEDHLLQGQPVQRLLAPGEFWG